MGKVGTGQKEPFAGFVFPQFTQVPDDLIDAEMAGMAAGELKVVLYVCRRTFGFRRDSAEISLSQMEHGLVVDGERVDRGTGMSRRQLIRAIRSLRDRGFIVVEGGHGKRSTYRLRAQGEPVATGDIFGPNGESGDPPTGDIKYTGTRGKNVTRPGEKMSPVGGSYPYIEKQEDKQETNSNPEAGLGTDAKSVQPTQPKKDGGGKKKRGGSTTLNWVSELGDIYCAKTGASASAIYGQIGKALKPLVESMGIDEVRRLWKNYVEHCELQYLSPASFARKPLAWDDRRGKQRATPTAPADDDGPLTDEKLAAKYADRQYGWRP